MSLSFDNTKVAFQYRSNKDLKNAKFLFSSMSSPSITNLGMNLTKFGLKAGLPIKGIIRNTIFKQFCGGETMEEAAITAQEIAKYGVKVILDYGVEGKEGEAEFDDAVIEFIKAIQFSASVPDIPFISIKITAFARFALLEKLHEGADLTDEEIQEWQRVINRIDQVCKMAFEKNIMVLIDAEESWIQMPIDVVTDEMMNRYNRGKITVFNTFQLYLTSRLSFLQSSMDKAKAGGYLLGAKLVRGAYMEKERARAEELNYPSPVQPNKPTTDKDYNAAVAYCLENLENCYLFIGTHNEYSCTRAVELIHTLKLNHALHKIYFSQLYGMSDNISFNLANEGFQVAKYLPYGPVKDVMPYLMRRAQENTSVAGQTSRELDLIQKEIARRKKEQ